MDFKKIEKVSKERLDICATCPFRKSFNEETKLWELAVEKDECGICGCPLQVKSMSDINNPEKIHCPKNLW